MSQEGAAEDLAEISHDNLLTAFRIYYSQLEGDVIEATTFATDLNVISRLGDEVDEFLGLIRQHNHIFDAEELPVLETNLTAMQHDIRMLYEQLLDQSHSGFPSVITREQSGRRGRPRIVIDRGFLEFAITRRSTAGIAHFLGVSPSTVRNALLDEGLALPGNNPFPPPSTNPPPIHPTQSDHPSAVNSPPNLLPPPNAENLGTPNHELDDHLNPALPSIPELLPQDLPLLVGAGANHNPQEHSLASNIGLIEDHALDALVENLRAHYPRAGITMMHGMLRRLLGFSVPRERIRAALLRIDPVRWVFDRIRIRRRVYSVPGPNALWHHDGQHGLIRWGIIIHGFIDGYSRLITGLRASDNNRANTVLDIFLNAIHVYGVPSRLRGDHGTENLAVAAWMEQNHGIRRGSYIWGRSVHNVRIERLWGDVTAQVGSTWSTYFTTLELHHGLDINNVNHVWLLHHLFLPILNSALAFFAESWNEHVIQIRDGPNRSPADMFSFDMLTCGVRGIGILDDSLPPEELEIYGVDWEGLRDDDISRSEGNERSDSVVDGISSWVGQTGPPARLNEVMVEPPPAPLTEDEIHHLHISLDSAPGLADGEGIIDTWNLALLLCRSMRPDLF